MSIIKISSDVTEGNVCLCVCDTDFLEAACVELVIMLRTVKTSGMTFTFILYVGQVSMAAVCVCVWRCLAYVCIFQHRAVSKFYPNPYLMFPSLANFSPLIWTPWAINYFCALHCL